MGLLSPELRARLDRVQISRGAEYNEADLLDLNDAVLLLEVTETAKFFGFVWKKTPKGFSLYAGRYIFCRDLRALKHNIFARAGIGWT